jgi:hypothetical protein
MRDAKIHWFLGYSKKTACGMLAYPTDWRGEYDTPTCGRIFCAVDGRSEDVSCLRCQKIMMLGRWSPRDDDPRSMVGSPTPRG